jgi:hypothetical protein
MYQYRTTPRPRHLGTKINANGDVSALCFAKPRKINLAHASWVLRPEDVTCPKCKKLLTRPAGP